MFVDLTMKAFREIYVAKGRSVNPHKCKIILGNVDECTKQEILNVTSFSEGNLPFRYLRIPLTSKKLLMAHFRLLVEKIMARINNFSAHLLSFIGSVAVNS